MSRAIWNGSISFGLVQIPVGVHTAEKSGESLSFSLLDKRDMSPIGYKQINKVTGEEVPKDARVKGYEVEKNEYVIVEDDDFKRANVKKTETIDIHSFVDAEDIPVTRFEKPYYLSPPKKGVKAYALLRDALANTGKVAIATIVLRNREQIAAIMPYEGALVMEMLRFDYEIADVDDVVDADVKKAHVTDAELEMAEALVKGMAADFDTKKLHDSYRDDLLALIEERRANPEMAVAPLPKKQKAKKSADVIDIMALLKQSVAKQKKGEAANTDEEVDAAEGEGEAAEGGGTKRRAKKSAKKTRRKASATRTRARTSSRGRKHG